MENEDVLGRRLLAPLADVQGRTASISIAKAIAAARSRRRTRRIACFLGAGSAAAAAIVALPLLTPPAHDTFAGPSPSPVAQAPSPSPSPSSVRTPATPQPRSCTGSKLAVADGRPKSYAAAVDPTGTYATGRNYPGDNQQLLWTDGGVKILPMTGDDGMFNGITSRGVAVGGSFVGGKQKPWIYSGGAVHALPGVKEGYANAINEAGVIVGEGILAGDPGIRTRPLIWRSATSPAAYLESDPSSYGRALDVDEDGTAVGELDQRAYVWLPDGSGHALPPATYKGSVGKGGLAGAITNGWVTGNMDFTTGSPSVRWDLRTGEAIAIDQITTSGSDVTASGWVTGWTAAGHAGLSDGKELLVLPDVVRFPSQYGLNLATAITPDGSVIVGTVDDGDFDGRLTAVIWHCH